MKTQEPEYNVWQFPPEGTVAAHKVKAGDNWWKLATQYGFADPWTIIEFNYRTRKPEEVNWYLERFVGCTKSNDGTNYSFDTADSFGIVYIPPKNWKSSKGTLVEPLSDAAIHAVIELAGVKLPYVNASNIENAFGKIFIVADPNLPVQAEYNYNQILYMRTPKGARQNPTYDRMLLVKEICHIAYGKFGLRVPFSARTEAVSLLCGRAFHQSRPEWKKLPYTPAGFFRGTPLKSVYATLDQFLNDYAKNPHSCDLNAVARMVEREPYFMQRLHGHWPRGAAKAA